MLFLSYLGAQVPVAVGAGFGGGVGGFGCGCGFQRLFVGVSSGSGHILVVTSS